MASRPFLARPGQALRDHLSQVSERAGEFAKEFGAPEWGRIVGLLHDIGKYSAEFSARLEGDPARVDHATAGAVEARKAYRHGRLLAYVIAGHHGRGLANSQDLTVRLAKELCPYQDFQQEISLPEEPAPPSLTPLGRGLEGFSAAFFTRMLFSCLVDADRLDAEQEGSPDKAAMRQGRPALGSLAPLLDRFLATLQAAAQDSEVNRLRRGILDQCRAAARLPPGLFSLTVPTGGGKTLSSMAFALGHAEAHDLRRIIYVIPYTSIIEQNAAVFRGLFSDAAVLEHHSSVELPGEGSDADHTALAASLAMENWDAPVVVTTNVQFLESLFACRPSRCRKLHNIARSVVILDEAQMLPTELLRPTLAALKELTVNYGCSVVLCTATPPAVQDLFPGGAEIREIMRSPGPADLYEAFRRVRVELAGELATPALAERMLGQEQCLCVVNTRRHARELFPLLKGQPGAHHLSASMCPEHRSRKLAAIRADLKAGKPCRVVSTSLVEAGVDVDFPVVLRAMAGVDSLAQAAGRCNREGLLPEPGRMLVFTSAEHKPRGWQQRAASIGGSVCRTRSDDPLSLEAVAAYFGNLYGLTGSGLDAKGVLDLLKGGTARLDFPFHDVAEAYRVIEDTATTVFIPYDNSARSLLDAVRSGRAGRSTFRRLQRYGVRVYDQDLRALQDWLETVAEGVLALVDRSSYDEETGLVSR